MILNANITKIRGGGQILFLVNLTQIFCTYLTIVLNFHISRKLYGLDMSYMYLEIQLRCYFVVSPAKMRDRNDRILIRQGINFYRANRDFSAQALRNDRTPYNQRGEGVQAALRAAYPLPFLRFVHCHFDRAIAAEKSTITGTFKLRKMGTF